MARPAAWVGIVPVGKPFRWQVRNLENGARREGKGREPSERYAFVRGPKKKEQTCGAVASFRTATKKRTKR